MWEEKKKMRRKDGVHPGRKGDGDLEGEDSDVGGGEEISSACYRAPFRAIEIMATFLRDT